MSYWVLLPAAPLSGAMIASCLRKARGNRSSVELRNRLGVAPGLWSGIGVLEGAAAAGLLVGLVVPAVGTAAAAGVALLMLGAIIFHLQAGLAGRPLLPPSALLAVAVTAALGFSTAA